MVNPSTHLENDEFGYSCYTIVIPAPPVLTELLLEIERAAGQKRAKIPAHVTVKGTLYGIASLDGMIETIREIAGRHEPFELGTAGMKVWDSSDSLILGFDVNPEIQALHDELVATISPLGKPAYKDDPYGVHMSIVNEAGEQGVEVAMKMLKDVDFGDSLSVSTIDLMGRDGVASGGVWKRLERFELNVISQSSD